MTGNIGTIAAGACADMLVIDGNPRTLFQNSHAGAA